MRRQRRQTFEIGFSGQHPALLGRKGIHELAMIHGCLDESGSVLTKDLQVPEKQCFFVARVA